MMSKLKYTLLTMLFAAFVAQPALASPLNNDDMAFAFGGSPSVSSDLGEMALLSDQEMKDTEGEWLPLAIFVGRIAYTGYRAYRAYRATRAVRPIAGVIRGYTRHGLNQAISRNGRGVAPRAILNAVRNPRSVSSRGWGWNRTTRYNGRDATVVTNRWGQVVTTWARRRGNTRY